MKQAPTTKLCFDGQGMTSLKHAKTLPSATWLSAQHNTLETADGVEAFPKLVTLNLSHNLLVSCTAIAKLRNLRALILSHNKLTTVCDLSALPDLNTLVLSHNPLAETANLACLPSLTKLSASDCGLRALPWHGASEVRLPKLLDLRLNNNRIQHLDGILACTSLQRLVLKDNEIPTLEALKALTNLTHLTVDGNPGFAKHREPESHVLKLLPKLRYLNEKPTLSNVKARIKGQRRSERIAFAGPVAKGAEAGGKTEEVDTVGEGAGKRHQRAEQQDVMPSSKKRPRTTSQSSPQVEIPQATGDHDRGPPSDMPSVVELMEEVFVPEGIAFEPDEPGPKPTKEKKTKEKPLKKRPRTQPTTDLPATLFESRSIESW